MRGLYKKFTVIDNKTGMSVKERTFTLVPSRDKAAVFSLIEYAKHTENESLKNDLLKWLEELK